MSIIHRPQALLMVFHPFFQGTWRPSARHLGTEHLTTWPKNLTTIFLNGTSLRRVPQLVALQREKGWKGDSSNEGFTAELLKPTFWYGVIIYCYFTAGIGFLMGGLLLYCRCLMVFWDILFPGQTTERIQMMGDTGAGIRKSFMLKGNPRAGLKTNDNSCNKLYPIVYIYIYINSIYIYTQSSWSR